MGWVGVPCKSPRNLEYFSFSATSSMSTSSLLPVELSAWTAPRRASSSSEKSEERIFAGDVLLLLERSLVKVQFTTSITPRHFHFQCFAQRCAFGRGPLRGWYVEATVVGGVSLSSIGHDHNGRRA